MASPSQRQVLKLYKCLLTEARRFPSYNFRHFALRKIKDGFRTNKHLTDPNEVAIKLTEANKNLDIIRRQVVIGQMYATDKLVIENMNSRIRVNA